ncbi:two-component response regulator-like PRR37 [Impatiens glandulifera]|uniref:two-component response regulator-like PRR37 n=1 Tax=Impatiens glandulifera TaxID=253017 RepID=UPI001FB179F8|nr:two-component response regulator-like PRR37 [Impatiens glandulifera]
MKFDRVDSNGLANKGLAEHSHHKLDDRREVRGGATGEGQGLSEEDESRVNGDNEREKCECLDMARTSSVQQRSLQQSQGSVVHWERFLPLRSLKVLLVENDDSTRHVVSALLRNCSYEVVAGSDGLEAWNILTDLTNHIDLVLTEISMPNLSGIGLLSKIMNHKNFKDLPVIMMSSIDSMGIVFKCLSKGAVDFLVKPIRKNELKNLWQHVWRKYHSSSCSGSESGVRIQKSLTSNSAEESENNSDSMEEDDIGSIELNARDGSDNGSGIQSSWTKRAVEVDSPQHMFPWDRRVADPPDSTCAQVIHSKPEAFCNNRLPVTATMDYHGQDCDLDKAMVKDSENGIIHKNTDLHLEKRIKTTSTTPAQGSNIDEPFVLESGKDGKEIDKGKFEKNNDTINAKARKKSGDAIGGSINRSDPQMEIIGTEVESNVTQMNNKGKNVCRAKDIPTLELRLKRMRDDEEFDMSTIERNVFKHSDLSAFSRYNTMSTTNQAPTGIVGSCSPQLDHSSEVEKMETVQNFQSNSNGIPDQGSNGSSNNNDMGSTTNNNNTKPVANSVVKLHPSCSKFDPVETPPLTSLQSIMQNEVNTVSKDNNTSAQERGMNPHVQVQHHYHHYHHHHHHVHGTKQQLHFLNHDNPSLKTSVAKDPNCGVSDASQKKPREGNAANYSLNSSGSGSNNGSDGQNGSSGQIGSNNAITTNDGEKVAMVIDNSLAGKGEVGAATANGCRMGLDQNRLTQREAALNKFRQKRKERCFEKKVRYQSRKRLAEQRPRIRGQFVRQVARENGNNEEEDS